MKPILRNGNLSVYLQNIVLITILTFEQIFVFVFILIFQIILKISYFKHIFVFALPKVKYLPRDTIGKVDGDRSIISTKTSVFRHDNKKTHIVVKSMQYSLISLESKIEIIIL